MAGLKGILLPVPSDVTGKAFNMLYMFPMGNYFHEVYSASQADFLINNGAWRVHVHGEALRNQGLIQLPGPFPTYIPALAGTIESMALDRYLPGAGKFSQWTLDGLSVGARTFHEQFSKYENLKTTEALLALEGTLLGGNDLIVGTTSDVAIDYDVLLGFDGNDKIYGQGGNDVLFGMAGNDVLDGGRGADKLYGADGSDTCYVDNGGRGQRIQCRRRHWRHRLGLLLSRRSRRLHAGRPRRKWPHPLLGCRQPHRQQPEQPALRRAGQQCSQRRRRHGHGVVRLRRKRGQDQPGSGRRPTRAAIPWPASRTSQADRLASNSTANKINGGAGSDTLVGGLGKDSLSGGAGKDLFDFNTLAEAGLDSAGRDVITDFARGQDRIDLSTLDANIATSFNNAFTGLIAGSAAFRLPGQQQPGAGRLDPLTQATPPTWWACTPCAAAVPGVCPALRLRLHQCNSSPQSG